MAIAANFRKFPHAMALQLVLPLGRPVWNTKRPTSRQGRAFRAYITKQMAALGLRREIVKHPIPQWWKDAQARAKNLAKQVKENCMRLELVHAFLYPVHRSPAPGMQHFQNSTVMPASMALQARTNQRGRSCFFKYS